MFEVAVSPSVVRQGVEDVILEILRRIETTFDDSGNVSFAAVDCILARLRRLVFLNYIAHAQAEDGEIGRIRIMPSERFTKHLTATVQPSGPDGQIDASASPSFPGLPRSGLRLTL